MAPLPLILGIAGFGIAKLSGASTKKAILAGGLAALGGYGLQQAGILGAAGGGGTLAGAKTAADLGAVNPYYAELMKSAGNQAYGAAAETAGSGIFSKGLALAKKYPGETLGATTAAGTLLAGAMTPAIPAAGTQGMGSEEEYRQAYARAREGTEGLGQRASYTDQGGFVSPDIYAAKEGGLAEIKKFSQGGVNYLPSKTDHDENDYNNYVRAEGYVEDGAGNGDKDEDTMLAQLADGEFVSRADAVLGAGIMQGASPKDFKQMRRMGAKYFYNQQDQLKRIYDMVS